MSQIILQIIKVLEIKGLITIFLLFYRKMSGIKNPWSVSKLEDFLYYNCPECNDKYKLKEPFILHAFKKHPKSKKFLELQMESDNVMIICPMPQQSTSFELVQNQDILIQNNVTYEVLEDDDQNDTHNIEDYSNHTIKSTNNHPNKIYDYQMVKRSPSKILKKEKYIPYQTLKNSEIKQKNVVKPSKILTPTFKYSKCDHCGKRFGRKFDLTRHLQNVHGKQNSPPTSSKDKTKNDTDYDIFDNPFVDKRKAEEPSGIFICDICDHNFSNSNSLSKHILTVHDSTKITNCDQCGKDFSNKKGNN